MILNPLIMQRILRSKIYATREMTSKPAAKVPRAILFKTAAFGEGPGVSEEPGGFAMDDGEGVVGACETAGDWTEAGVGVGAKAGGRVTEDGEGAGAKAGGRVTDDGDCEGAWRLKGRGG